MNRIKALTASAVAVASLVGAFAVQALPASANDEGHTAFLSCDDPRTVRVNWHLDGSGYGTRCFGVTENADWGLMYSWEFYSSTWATEPWIDGISTGDHRVLTYYGYDLLQNLPKWSTYYQPTNGPWKVTRFHISSTAA